MRRHLSAILATLVGAFVLGGTALGRLGRDGETARVSFTALGPAGMKIVGSTNELLLRDDGQHLVISVPLGGLKTGIALRDRHLREKYLEVARFPQAQLTVARSALKAIASGTVTAEAPGTLKLHGVSRPSRFQYTATRKGPRLDVTGRLRLDIRDFGIPIPKFMGLTVKPEVDVVVAFGVREST